MCFIKTKEERETASNKKIEEPNIDKEKEQDLSEISELEKKQKKAEEDKRSLSAIKVEKSRLYKRKGYIGEQPIIEIKIKNGTKHSLSRLHFKGTLASPGRKVPWLVEDFNYSISGGLEPEESQEWSLAPNQFSKWGTVELKKDAIFTVEVVEADDHRGETLFSLRDFSDDDRERLENLKAQHVQK